MDQIAGDHFEYIQDFKKKVEFFKWIYRTLPSVSKAKIDNNPIVK